MELHINQRNYLVNQILAVLPEFEFDKLDTLFRNLTEKRYKFLLALKYNKKIEELKAEIKKSL